MRKAGWLQDAGESCFPQFVFKFQLAQILQLEYVACHGPPSSEIDSPFSMGAGR